MTEKEASPPSGETSKKKPRWQATVDLPQGSALANAKPFVIKFAGATEYVDTLADIPLDGLEPARGFISRATKRNRPNRPWLYNQSRRIEVESETEAIEAHLADRNPNVEFIVPQGVWVKSLVIPLGSSVGGPQWRWSCVDFVIGYRDGTVEAVEVKRHAYEFRVRPATAKLLATADACEMAGFGYRLLAGLSKRETQVFYQLHSARRASYLQHPEADRLRFEMRDLAAAETVTIGELRNLGGPLMTSTLVWELLWNGVLCVNWQEPIASSSPVRCHGPLCSRASGHSAWDFVCGPDRGDMLPALRDWAAQL